MSMVGPEDPYLIPKSGFLAALRMCLPTPTGGWPVAVDDEDHPGDCGCPDCLAEAAEPEDTADEHDYDDELYHGTGREPVGGEEW